jgi:hypothetical protein
MAGEIDQAVALNAKGFQARFTGQIEQVDNERGR